MKNFLNKKGITDKTIRDFQIEVHPDILHFPIFDDQKNILYKKYRKKDQPEMMPPGGTSALYGIHTITDDNKSVLITEGATDMLAAQSIGIRAVTSTTGVMSFKEVWFSHPKLHGKQLVVCFDNDEAGHKGALRMWRMNPDLYFAFIPDNQPIKSDLSDYIVKYGGDKAKAMLNTARRIKEGYTTHLNIKFEPEEEIQVKHYQHSLDPIDENRVARAKLVPIPDILSFNNKKQAKCPWHHDSNPSLMWNPKNNTVKCFVCGAFGDSIAVVQKEHNKTFWGALNYLVGPAPNPPAPDWKKYYERKK